MSAANTRLTRADFIAKAQAKHGRDRYDYSLVNYISSSQKVEIVCPTHGAFWQEANSHMQGSGCRACHFSSRPAPTKDKFVERARKAHGDKYDYSELDYITSQHKVTIICPIHGRFWQVANSHISGRGCPKCGASQAAQSNRFATADFIEKAQQVHGNRFDYSRVAYTDSASKVEIGCPTHGFFWQVANTHVQGHGCCKCRNDSKSNCNQLSWVERAAGKKCILYLVRLFTDDEEFYKVGITFNEVEHRLQACKIRPYQYEVLATYKSTNAAAVHGWEESIKETFAHLAYRPKHSFGGRTECFIQADEILNCFPL